VKKIIPYKPELKIHLFSPPAFGQYKVLSGLSQPTICLKSYTYKKTIKTVEYIFAIQWFLEWPKLTILL
jgi:hypothetical protein